MKLGIAFSGGGCRGSSHLGIMKALYENDIRPEIFAGTSAGAIVASLLAYGVEPENALEVFKNASSNIIDVDYFGLLTNIIHPHLINGIAKGKALESILEQFFNGMPITNIKSPLAMVSTDINSGSQIIFSNIEDVDHNLICDDNYVWLYNDATPISKFITASCSLPVVFKPKQYGKYNLVDGGLTNNLPADAVKAMGADRIISIDLGLAHEVRDTHDIVHIVTQSISIFMERASDNSRMDFDIYLNPRIYDVHVLDTERIEECFDRGYQYAINNMDNIKQQLGGK